MPVSDAFRVAKGGFTSLAGQVDGVARAGIAALRRQLADLNTVNVWTSPINGGITEGAGATVARYSQVGDVTFCYFKFTLAADSEVTGSISLALPVDTAINRFAGQAWYFDVSEDPDDEYPGWVTQTSDNGVAILRSGVADATPLSARAISSTDPFDFTTGDIIVANFWYYHA